MNTRDEGSAFLRYRKPAVFIRKYMSEELIYLCQLPTAISPSGRMTGACRRKDNFCYPE